MLLNITCRVIKQSQWWLAMLQVYVGCNCTEDGRATKGMCPKECNMLIPYAIVLFLSKFIASMDVIPTMHLFMR